MGYQPHQLLSFGGHLGHAEEGWACGIRLKGFNDGDGVPAEEEDYLDDIALPALAAWFQAADTQIHDGARLQWVKFNQIDADGHYATPTVTHERQVNYSGGKAGTTNAHPLQVCMVTSFRTNAATRGKGAFGRIYVPRPVVNVDTNGDIASNWREAAATSMATLLNALDFSMTEVGVGAVFRPAIVSRGTAPTFADEGPANQIDYVIVDSCLDIQRRRAFSQSREQSRADVTY